MISLVTHIAVGLTGSTAIAVQPAYAMDDVPDADASMNLSVAHVHYERGHHAYDAGDYDQAHMEFARAVELVSARVAEPSTTSPHSRQPVPIIPMTPATEMPLRQEHSTVVRDMPVVRGSDVLPMHVAPYLVRAGDHLNIMVWQAGDLSHEVIVRPDGRISFPLVGELPAAGLTLTEIGDLLTDRLRVYVREPHVSIELAARAYKPRVTVLGEVTRQGVYTFEGRNTITVLEAIGMAEGTSAIGAKVKDVVVIKGYPRNPQLVHVNVKNILKHGKDPQKLLINDGDIVFVSRTWVGNIHSFLNAARPMFEGINTIAVFDKLINEDDN